MLRQDAGLAVAHRYDRMRDQQRLAGGVGDFAEHRIYANIKSDLPLKADNPDSAFLRIYGGGFNVENDFSEGYCEMVRVANWFEDPMGWVCPIPKKWDKFETIKGARIVAYAGPDLKKIWDQESRKK